MFGSFFGNQGSGAPQGGGALGQPTLVEWFTRDHQTCDTRWAAVETAAGTGDVDATNQAWQAFEDLLRRHLAMEEEVIFPAFEQASGMMGGGPTFVMKAEHQQMRGVLDVMATQVRDGDLDGMLDQGDTLLMLIQQHNAKEEGMLYPMATEFLAPQWDDLYKKLERYLS